MKNILLIMYIASLLLHVGCTRHDRMVNAGYHPRYAEGYLRAKGYPINMLGIGTEHPEYQRGYRDAENGVEIPVK